MLRKKYTLVLKYPSASIDSVRGPLSHRPFTEGGVVTMITFIESTRPDPDHIICVQPVEA